VSLDVVITGAGTVGPPGAGLEPLRESLREGRLELSPVEALPGRRPGGARLAGRLPEDPFQPWLSPREARRMSPASRMAVCVARMAVHDANLEKEELAGPGLAVSLGTAFGSTTYTAALLQQALDAGPTAISPLLFMETVANAHAGQIALALGATGSNLTISQRESSGLLAVARGADLLRQGRAERVLAGSVDEVSPIQHHVLDRVGALARPTPQEDRELPRVFGAERDGFVISEGGTVFVLEPGDRARDRGTPILARLTARARAADPSAPLGDWGHGAEELAERLTGELRRQGIDLDSIDRVVSGANGSPRGDLLEARVLRAAFGNALPPVLAPKSVTGEYGGGFLASALLALDEVEWAPGPGCAQPDPELDLPPHDGERLAPARRLLLTCLASGGSACWLVLDREPGA